MQRKLTFYYYPRQFEARGQGQAGSVIPQGQSLTVVVGDHVGMGGSTVRKAARLAQRILRDAGVSTEWTTCFSTESEGVSF